ncbi:hypothetical protein K443DRAFT_683185 [Laccaria amethystina LaAM-08-1]|uniref:Uncharacterized protein n=1 Tax=Laccaria amethystina LaAM-08-1 TaxID=1095629 RepID=A0A0C9WJT3_9AGAR|nr:hypothetical protein K443DRAFT_683185 [Laccaria amethystina LaAM-08-1]
METQTLHPAHRVESDGAFKNTAGHDRQIYSMVMGSISQRSPWSAYVFEAFETIPGGVNAPTDESLFYGPYNTLLTYLYPPTDITSFPLSPSDHLRAGLSILLQSSLSKRQFTPYSSLKSSRPETIYIGRPALLPTIR